MMKSLVVLLLSVCAVSCLNVQLEKEEFCIFSKVFKEETLCLHYVVSGQNEKNVIMNVYDGESKGLKPIHSVKN